MIAQLIVEKIKKLKPTQQEEVLDFIEFLAHKYKKRPTPKYGSGRGTFKMMPDFDEPLDDFKEYMD